VRAVAAALAVLAMAACSSGGDATAESRAARATTTHQLVETTTTAPGPVLTGQPLIVVEQGVSAWPDPFDHTATLGGYGVILQNPNPDLLASGVRVVTRVLDPAGTELLVDSTLLNGVMPGQRMALGRTLIEPIVDPTQLAITVEVTSWLRPTAPEGGLQADSVVTEPEEHGGAVTRFTVRSTWPEPEEGVDVTAVYRAADGRILAAESTVLASVPVRGDVAGQIRLLSPIPDLVTTEVFVGRGLAAHTTG
jgi:hypothetical protein